VSDAEADLLMDSAIWLMQRQNWLINKTAGINKFVQGKDGQLGSRYSDDNQPYISNDADHNMVQVSYVSWNLQEFHVIILPYVCGQANV
jgi:hypothetical protein